MSNLVKIGTRGSKLALWQAYHVEELLQKSGLDTEIVLIDTKGDQILDVSISKIGSKGVFTQELEDQLLDGRIDIAVHSAKDLQSSLPDGFEIIAFTDREKENDVLVSFDSTVSLKDKYRALVIGTSSTRRVSTLKHFYPHIRTVDVRGNLQTRIRKMEEGLCDALLLAYAGVHRMGYNHLISSELDLNEFTPAVGQGSVAIEVASKLDEVLKSKIAHACNHFETGQRLKAERSYLRILEGGCSIPIFALAKLEGTAITMKGGILSLDGKERISLEVSGDMNRPEELGEQLAALVFAAGGKEILDHIKMTLNR
jgi:hydroxymethylbilane synthase